MKRLSQLMLASLCIVALHAWAADDNELTRLLRHQTDLGSDAGQRGDQATVDSFLDEQVVFSGGDGSVSLLYCGLVRERGKERTSTTSWTSAPFNNPMNASSGRTECPIVKNGLAIYA